MVDLRGGSKIDEAGGVITYTMTPDVAEELARILYATNDKGFIQDADALQDRVERIKVFRALLRD